MSRTSNWIHRNEHLKWITSFLDDHDMSYRFLAGDWHMRVENILDIFPTRNRYFFLPTKERGSFDDYDELGEIILGLVADQRSQDYERSHSLVSRWRRE